MRSGGAVRGPPRRSPRSFLPLALEPLVSRAYAHAGRVGGLFDAQALHEDAVQKQGSTARRQMGMFLQVHPGLLGTGLVSYPHLPAMPQMNNLLRDHT